jgi:hypothetical protein
MKNVICLNVWTTHVYDQRFKRLGIHSKSIVPLWATINFPLIDPNMFQDCGSVFCNNAPMTSTNKSKV